MEPCKRAGAWSVVGRRRALIALGCMMLMALASSEAHARVVLVGHTPASNTVFQRWADEVHAPTPNITLYLRTGFCPYFEGRTCVAVNASRLNTADLGNHHVRWEIWVPEIGGDYGPPSEWWHLDFLQELGHVYDFAGRHSHSYRTAFDRIFDYEQGFRAWIGVSNPWAALNDIQEKFAMYYAYCGAGLSYHGEDASSFRGFGVEPGASEYARACQLIARLPAERASA
jgi:hypothetical protein